MMLPGLVYYVIYRYLPIFGAIVSFKDYKAKMGILLSPWAEPFYKNLEFFFKSPYITQLLSNTLIISIAKILISIPFAVLLAVMLNETKNKFLKRSVQTLTYMPYFLSWVVIYGICFVLLSESSGIVNNLWQTVFHTKIPFFTSPKIFRWLIIFSDVWRNTGWAAILYLAAISNISPSLYEAAYIDGASRMQTILHITLPSIREIVLLVVILRCGSIMDAGFDQVYVMYNPVVYSTSDIIDTWVFRTGIENYNISLASAVGLFKSFIALILVLFTNRIAKSWGGSMW